MPKHIAVIGGGITGLSSAFHLSRRFPSTPITLLEGKHRLGGWIQSKRVELPQGDSVLLEMGPRTLRPNAKSLLELVHLLELKDKLITVPKSSPAAKTRFVYIPRSSSPTPGIKGLQALPSSILSLLTSPLRPVLLPAVLKEPFKSPNRPNGITDESLDSFLSRRFGDAFAHTFGSALVHGIYAADSRNLSVRAAFPTLWEAEERGRGSVVRGFLLPQRKAVLEEEEYELGDIPEMMREVSVYSFNDGMETLSNALAEHLAKLPNVDIKLGTKVSELGVKDGEFEMRTQWGEHLEPSHIVSCIPLPALSYILSSYPSPTHPQLPHTSKENTIISSVQVVNFVFPVPPSEIHPQGFGYLIPRPLRGYPTDPTPPGVLGTVFDSSSLYLQEAPVQGDYYTQGKLTKLTMMVGGPYPLTRHPEASGPSYSSTDFPEQPEIITALLHQLEKQLKRKLPKPVYWHVHENKRCIPTPQPGHLERMREMRDVLLDMPGVEGRLDVVGAYVDGVSVGDCVEAGRRAGKDWEDDD